MEKKGGEDFLIKSIKTSKTTPKASKSQFYIKKFVKENEPELEVSSVDFSVFSDRDIKRLSQLEIFVPEIYNSTPERKFNEHGPLDLRLGTSLVINTCKTCGRNMADCVGHFGHIDLPFPVYHVGYFKKIIRIYQSVCKTCARILLSDEQKTKLREKLRTAKKLGKQEVRRLEIKITDSYCSKTSECFNCGNKNGKTIKGPKFFGLLYRPPLGKTTENNIIESFRTAVKMNPDIENYIKNGSKNPNSLNVFNLFKRIPNEDLVFLNIGNNRPEDFIITSLFVPPACIRPTVRVDDSKSQEDDLTGKLREIIKICNNIKDNEKKGGISAPIRDLWVLLQSEVARYINSNMTGFPKTSPAQKKQMLSLVQRLTGKNGRFRGNLSGKRVDFSARSVISPDPNVEIDQVIIPRKIAQILTYPDTVNKHNIETLRNCIRNGPDIYPGANFVLCKERNSKKFLKYGDRDETANELRLGDVVERHLLENDVVLFNRQPSLHKMSIMAHRVRVMESRTLRFNLCVCNPYNADFDGDEMNVHIPQTEEARAEAACLMAVQNNFITPKCGEPLIVPIQDFLTASYLLTNKDRFYKRAEFMQICCHFASAAERVKVPPPAILKPRKLWSGKQVIGVLLRPNSNEKWPLVYLETPTKQYPTKPPCKDYPRESLDPLDRYVTMRNSVLLSGALDKKILGSSKTGLFSFLISNYGPKVTALIMGRLSKLCARWLGEFGFSIGIDDVTPSGALTELKNKLIDEGYQECDDYEEEFRKGTLKPQSGCTMLETLEAKMLGKLSEIREKCGSLCIESLSYFSNSPIIMAACGAKGSTINIAQMISCVGQQALQSGRIPEEFENRTLPHFKEFSKSPKAKGFVRNSFFTGLNATEFFFHTMAGREGLIDTAVKTAETGYMQRRLMKALEDSCVQYDNTVRNSENVVLQFTYGEDGLDPKTAKPMENSTLIKSFKYHLSNPFRKGQRSLTPSQIKSETKKHLDDLHFDKYSYQAGLFKKTILEFINGIVIKIIKEIRKKLLLPLNKNSSSDKDTEKYFKKNFGITSDVLRNFIKENYKNNITSLVEPGTAVGAIGAQSIGEPSTQMTLKTFHFAGVASMNITLGVPRIKEIINAVTNIKTPIINAALDCVSSEQVARIVKGRLEITTLGGICKYIRQFICHDYAFIEILIDKTTTDILMLNIDSFSVKESILKDKKIKLKEENIQIVDFHKLRIVSPDNNRNTLLFSLELLSLLLPKVQVHGIKNIHRAVIRHSDPPKYRWKWRNKNNLKKNWKHFDPKEDEVLETNYSKGCKSVMFYNGDDVWTLKFIKKKELNKEYKNRQKDTSNKLHWEAEVIRKQRKTNILIERELVDYELTVEGTDFVKAMTTSGVDGLRTTTNLILEIEKTLGIEAAREAIARELQFTFSVHGLTVDSRHTMLLADLMTFKGTVLGITRFGISKMRESVLMQASFETPMDHLFAAAAECSVDTLKGVSECIIVGKTMPIGSGTFCLLRKVENFKNKEEERIFNN